MDKERREAGFFYTKGRVLEASRVLGNVWRILQTNFDHRASWLFISDVSPIDQRVATTRQTRDSLDLSWEEMMSLQTI